MLGLLGIPHCCEPKEGGGSAPQGAASVPGHGLITRECFGFFRVSFFASHLRGVSGCATSDTPSLFVRSGLTYVPAIKLPKLSAKHGVCWIE